MADWTDPLSRSANRASALPGHPRCQPAPAVWHEELTCWDDPFASGHLAILKRNSAVIMMFKISCSSPALSLLLLLTKCSSYPNSALLFCEMNTNTQNFSINIQHMKWWNVFCNSLCREEQTPLHRLMFLSSIQREGKLSVIIFCQAILLCSTGHLHLFHTVSRVTLRGCSCPGASHFHTSWTVWTILM